MLLYAFLYGKMKLAPNQSCYIINAASYSSEVHLANLRLKTVDQTLRALEARQLVSEQGIGLELPLTWDEAYSQVKLHALVVTHEDGAAVDVNEYALAQRREAVPLRLDYSPIDNIRLQLIVPELGPYSFRKGMVHAQVTQEAQKLCAALLNVVELLSRHYLSEHQCMSLQEVVMSSARFAFIKFWHSAEFEAEREIYGLDSTDMLWELVVTSWMTPNEEEMHTLVDQATRGVFPGNPFKDQLDTVFLRLMSLFAYACHHVAEGTTLVAKVKAAFPDVLIGLYSLMNRLDNRPLSDAHSESKGKTVSDLVWTSLTSAACELNIKFVTPHEFCDELIAAMASLERVPICHIQAECSPTMRVLVPSLTGFYFRRTGIYSVLAHPNWEGPQRRDILFKHPDRISLKQDAAKKHCSGVTPPILAMGDGMIKIVFTTSTKKIELVLPASAAGDAPLALTTMYGQVQLLMEASDVRPVIYPMANGCVQPLDEAEYNRRVKLSFAQGFWRFCWAAAVCKGFVFEIAKEIGVQPLLNHAETAAQALGDLTDEDYFKAVSMVEGMSFNSTSFGNDDSAMREWAQQSRARLTLPSSWQVPLETLLNECGQILGYLQDAKKNCSWTSDNCVPILVMRARLVSLARLIGKAWVHINGATLSVESADYVWKVIALLLFKLVLKRTHKANEDDYEAVLPLMSSWMTKTAEEYESGEEKDMVIYDELFFDVPVDLCDEDSPELTEEEKQQLEAELAEQDDEKIDSFASIQPEGQLVPSAAGALVEVTDEDVRQDVETAFTKDVAMAASSSIKSVDAALEQSVQRPLAMATSTSSLVPVVIDASEANVCSAIMDAFARDDHGSCSATPIGSEENKHIDVAGRQPRVVNNGGYGMTDIKIKRLNATISTSIV